MTIRLADDSRDATTDAVVDLIDAGASAGYLEIRTGSQPTTGTDAATGSLLVTITLGDPAFGDSSSGTATAASITDATPSADGTGGWFRVYDSDDNPRFDGSVTATGGGGDMELNTTSITTGEDVSVTAFTYTTPAG